MSGTLLYRVVDAIIDKNRIEAVDVLRLTRDVFPDGLTHRDDADILIALDRAVADKDLCWSGALKRLVVDFVVWACRPTGLVDAETARWLTTSLACGDGPSDLALRIAFEVVTESERVDETLVAFVLRGRRGRKAAVDRLRKRPALAA